MQPSTCHFWCPLLYSNPYHSFSSFTSHLLFYCSSRFPASSATMWSATPPRLSRTSSIHSLARSVTSSRGSSYEESIGEVEFPPQAELWKTPATKMDTVVKVLELERRNSISSEQPTLAGSMQEEELDPKTPTVGNMPSPTGRISQASTAPVYNAGPLEQ